MKRWIHLSGALTLALAVSACAGDRSPDADTRTTGDAAVGTAGTGDARADEEFVREQMAMGEAEITLGELAQQKGNHPEVKRFGEMMVRDHRQAGEELRQITANANANQTTPAAGTEPQAERHGDHQDHIEELRNLSGAEFDRRYMERMVKDHEEAVRELERKAENANNPEVRQWASKTLPKVQQHLERARTIQETLEQSGDNNTRGNRPRGQ
ncbi:MAG TPA: DUF4142 domain-containing protein [Vicinamibacterales bacterium]|nr:DUF4142 domain-containing protein [Vicinamibacterales bacterium]